MTYLLQITIGPVQSFIAASRKTRDLAAGSLLLQQLNKEVQKVLEGNKASAILPASWQSEAANVIICTINQEPAAIVAKCEQAIKNYLVRCLDQLPKEIKSGLDQELAKRQLESFPELFAAWLPFDDAADYQKVRHQLGALVAARKATRNFGASPSPGAYNEPADWKEGRPKSPLDPAFDTVLRTGEGFRLAKNTDTRLKSREVLDATSLLKRFCSLNELGLEGTSSFPSTRAVAAAVWIAQAKGSTERGDLQAWITKNAEDDDLGDALAGDCQGGDQGELSRLTRAFLKKFHDGKQIRSYYAIVLADGDSMGEFLDGIESFEQHSEFSENLQKEFAQKAKGWVEAKHGTLIYAGGDDVLALCPIETVLELATDLEAKFKLVMSPLAEMCTSDFVPTLTVGIAITHCKNNLSDSLEFARAMERLGKNVTGKNSLSVGIKVGSGSVSSLVIKFNGEAFQQLLPLQQKFQKAGEQAEGTIPRGYPEEINQLAKDLRGVEAESSKFESLARAEIKRITTRKLEGSGDEVQAKLTELESLWGWVKTQEDVETFSSMLYLQHFMTRSLETNS